MMSYISSSFPSTIGSNNFVKQTDAINLITKRACESNKCIPVTPASACCPNKPMRPLTAYHIFFQIEREYIIQTMAGEDADKSIHENKVYLDDVPLRYKHIKLQPDWYFAPGKRQKRKHRKSHGKIGFLELSRVISTRWAELEQLDPETKQFVQQIAASELEEYQREMKEYKESAKNVKASALPNYISPNSSPSSSAAPSPSQSPAPMAPVGASSYPDMVASSGSNSKSGSINSGELSTAEIDYFISCITNNVDADHRNNEFLGKRKMMENQHQYQHHQHHHEQQAEDEFADLSFLDPILEFVDFEQDSSYFFVDQQTQQPSNKKQRRMSPSSVVDIGDDEIIQLWSSQNI